MSDQFSDQVDELTANFSTSLKLNKDDSTLEASFNQSFDQSFTASPSVEKGLKDLIDEVKQNQKAQSDWNSKMLDKLAELLETAKKVNMSTPQSAQKPARPGTLRALSQSRIIDPSDLTKIGVAFHYRQEDTHKKLLKFAKKFFEDIKTIRRYVGVTGYDVETKHLSLGTNNQNRFYEHLMKKNPPPNRMDVLKVFENKEDALDTEAYLHENLIE